MSRKPYVREISKTSWFMTHARYKSYVLHEVSCIFVALYSIVLIVGSAEPIRATNKIAEIPAKAPAMA